MKKVLLTSVLLVLLTGCGKVEKIKCTKEQKSFGVEMNMAINIKLKNDEFVSVDMTIDAILAEILLSQKQTLIEKIEDEYADFEEDYGVQPETIETDNGFQIKFAMTAEQAKEFYGSDDSDSIKATKKYVIETFESQGFTCE